MGMEGPGGLLRRGEGLAEEYLVEQALREATGVTLLAAELPTRGRLCRLAEKALADAGPCFVFRVRGDEADRFARELLEFWQEQAGGEPNLPDAATLPLLLAAQPPQDCFLLIDDAHLLDWQGELAALLKRLLRRCGRQVHSLLLSPERMPFLEQADMLPASTVHLTPESLVLDRRGAEECLRAVCPGLPGSDRMLVWELSGGWVSAMDVAVELLAAEDGRRAALTAETLQASLSELLERWTAGWGSETRGCMDQLCVAEELPEALALQLTGGKIGPLRRLAQQRFLVRCTETLDPVYSVNGVLRAWLYHQARRQQGRGFLLEQHRLAAAFGQEHGDWLLVFYHQLRRGYVEEAALTLRYLSFSELDAALLDEYRALMRRLSPAAIDRLPWVQLGYAIAMKYRHPNIAFRYLDRAIEIFRTTGDREGVVLACCQKISMGFFAPEQKATPVEFLQILAKEDFADGELDPILDGYRKVFTAYAIVQQGTDYQRAIELLEQTRETAIIRENENLRLWVCFVMILTYKDCQYENGLKTILDEALELVHAPQVQKPLKMCLYQTVAFLCYTEGGRYAEASACCERAARIAEEIGAEGYSVYIHMVHAYALDCLGRYSQAERVILDAAKSSGGILNVRNEHLWAYYLIGQSYHYFLKGDEGLALDTAEKALAYAARSGRVSYLTRALLVTGNILAEQGDGGRAAELAEQCLALCGEKAKYQFYRLSAYFLQAQLFRRAGRRKEFGLCMDTLAQGCKAAGIYHFNFAKPSVICETVREYTPREKDRTFFLQLQTYNELNKEDGNAAPVLITRPKTPLEINILGPLTVLAEGTALEPCASAKAARLLRLLALYAEPVGVHKLLEAIWPEWDEKSAMNNFYFTLHQLRGYLGSKTAVVYKRGLCELDRGLVTVDADLFGDLARSARQYLAAENLYAAGRYFSQAARLCRGRVLDGDDLPEDALLQQEALERDVFTALRDYGALCIRTQRTDRAEQVLNQAARNPFADEEVYRLLMKARYLSGNKSGALATYERLCEQLRTELGVEPHRLTRELMDRISRNQTVDDLADA